MDGVEDGRWSGALTEWSAIWGNGVVSSKKCFVDNIQENKKCSARATFCPENKLPSTKRPFASGTGGFLSPGNFAIIFFLCLIIHLIEKWVSHLLVIFWCSLALCLWLTLLLGLMLPSFWDTEQTTLFGRRHC